MGNSACAKRHFDVLGDFAFSSLQNYTVKCLDNEDSDSLVILCTYPLRK